MAIQRDYEAVIARLGTPTGDRESRMQRTVDALWDAFHTADVSWVGFYLKNDDLDELLLGPRRDKPACSPIALFGACGRAFQSRKPLIVSDVNNLRNGYIACDPRDRSEVVIPCMDAFDDGCWGVLDVDSHDTFAFNEADAHGLSKVLIHMGLHVAQSGILETV
jgi:putative methionine-R-sulfoxide reductase with GAF domain